MMVRIRLVAPVLELWEGPFVSGCGRARTVAGRLDSSDELLDPQILVALHRGLLGGEIHRCRHAVQLVQLLLDPRRAGGTGHPLEVEAERFLFCQRRRDFVSYAVS